MKKKNRKPLEMEIPNLYAQNSCTCEEATSVDALQALAECGILTPAYQDGVFYTDDSGAIYTL